MLRNIKCNVDTLFGGSDFDIDFNKISLFVGKNGTGKTVVLKLAWVGSYLAMARKQMMILSDNTELVLPNAESFVTFTLKKTFTDCNFTGKMEFTFDDDCSIELDLKEGECIKATYNNITATSKVSDIVFMSSEMRTFTAMCKYLKLRKRVSGIELILNETSLGEMLEDYPMYDVHTMEKLITRLPITFDSDIQKKLIEDFDFTGKPMQLSVDLDACKFNLIDENGSVVDMLNLGNGHQSIMNMFAVTLATGGR